jgi:hypothetical protein
LQHSVPLLDFSQRAFDLLELDLGLDELRIYEFVRALHLPRAVPGGLFDEHRGQSRGHALRPGGIGVGVLDDERILASNTDGGALPDQVDDVGTRRVHHFRIGVELIENALDSRAGQNLIGQSTKEIPGVLGGDSRNEALGDLSGSTSTTVCDILLGHEPRAIQRRAHRPRSPPVPMASEIEESRGTRRDSGECS